jgi:hypothetical protein
MTHDRGKIGHRARWNENSVILAGQLGAKSFKLVDCWVVAARGIAQRRTRDCHHHVRRRQSDRIASEIANGHSPLLQAICDFSDISV